MEGNPHNCSSSRSRWTQQFACENNRTILYISSNKFYLTDISYENRSIRVVDPGLLLDQKDNCSSSMPRYSLYNNDFMNFHLSSTSKLILYMNCSTRIVNSSSYMDASPCNNSSSMTKMYIYAIVEPTIMDFENSCSNILMSWISPDKDKFDSFYDLHDEMMKGFELDWFNDYSVPEVLLALLELKILVRGEVGQVISVRIGYAWPRKSVGFFHPLQRRG